MQTFDEQLIVTGNAMQPAFELTLIKAMIAAAKADGHIDSMEQQRIFKAIRQMDLSDQMKGMVFDLLEQKITVEELAKDIDKIEQKSELYLASCLAINPEHPTEQAHLARLSKTLKLPEGLAQQLQRQAQQAITEAA